MYKHTTVQEMDGKSSNNKTKWHKPQTAMNTIKISYVPVRIIKVFNKQGLDNLCWQAGLSRVNSSEQQVSMLQNLLYIVILQFSNCLVWLESIPERHTDSDVCSALQPIYVEPIHVMNIP